MYFNKPFGKYAGNRVPLAIFPGGLLFQPGALKAHRKMGAASLQASR
jgi:hypothetical protein